MIHYNLICSSGHQFDQWFDNMADYDHKHSEKALVCPQCGDTTISKALMAPRLSGSGGTVGATAEAAPACPMMNPHGGGCACC